MKDWLNLIEEWRDVFAELSPSENGEREFPQYKRWKYICDIGIKWNVWRGRMKKNGK